MEINIIVPLFKSKSNLSNLKDFILQLSSDFNISEIVFVDDNCPEQSGREIGIIFKGFAIPIKTLFLKPNIGSFMAIREAFKHSDNNPSLVFSADQQESRETLKDMANQLLLKSDLVLGCRAKREDPLFVKFFSYIFWRFFSKFVNPNFPKNGVDIFGLSKELRVSYLKHSNPHQNMFSELIKLTSDISYVNYVRLKRSVGKSSWTFSKKLDYAGDTFFLNSKLPITLLYWLSIIGFLISIPIIILVFFSSSETFWFPSLVTNLAFMLLFSSLNFLAFALIGSYLLRIQKLLINVSPRVKIESND